MNHRSRSIIVLSLAVRRPEKASKYFEMSQITNGTSLFMISRNEEKNHVGFFDVKSTNIRNQKFNMSQWERSHRMCFTLDASMKALH